MRYYIADLHFGHGGLNNRMDNRKFESVEAMDEYMTLNGIPGCVEMMKL